MATAADRRRYAGPALFSFGFRPFFFGGAAWSGLAVLLWIAQYGGLVTLPLAIGALDWHVHEMLFGFVAAVVAGFLLTAVPNWTGRLPVAGRPLAALAALWLAGRIAMLMSAVIGTPAAAVIDVAFLLALTGVAMREIVAGQNWRNLRVVGVLAVLIGGNIVFHLELVLRGSADYGIRLGIAGAIGLIMLIGGRVVPSFTRNWLMRRPAGRLPQPFDRFDGASLAGAGLALAAWVVWPGVTATGLLLVVAGLLQAFRLARWAGDRTVADRLVLVLHVAYGFIPVGFLLTGAAALWPAAVPASAGIHAFTAGAIGLMTLAVMTRASRGHSGQSLEATPATQAIYAAALVAALTRIVAAFVPAMLLYDVAAAAWVVAFGGFAVVYAPLLLLPRRS